MNTLNIKLVNTKESYPLISIDDKEVVCKKDKFGALNATFSTEKNEIEIKIKRLFEVNGPLWFLSSIFLFIISIFGIFDNRAVKNFYTFDTTFKIKLQENCDAKFAFKNKKANEQAIEVTATNCEVTEQNNVYTIDETAKKRTKILKTTKIFLWLALIATVATIIIL